MKVELATCPASWGVFWADSKPSGVPYTVFLDDAAKAGYVGLELGPVGYIPTEKEQMHKELESRGLVARAGTTCMNMDALQNFEEWKPEAQKLCELLQSLGARYLMMMDESAFAKTRAGKKAAPEKVEKCYGIIKEYNEFAKGYGVTVVFHPHVNTIVETEEEIEALMDKTGCMLCLDTGHHQLVNGKAVNGDDTTTQFYLKHHERIPFLHFKNVSAEGMQRYAQNPDVDAEAFCPLDCGVIDFAQFAGALRQTGYEGVGVVEQDMPHAPAEESFKLAVRNREYLEKTGVLQP